MCVAVEKSLTFKDVKAVHLIGLNVMSSSRHMLRSLHKSHPLGQWCWLLCETKFQISHAIIFQNIRKVEFQRYFSAPNCQREFRIVSPQSIRYKKQELNLLLVRSSLLCD